MTNSVVQVSMSDLLRNRTMEVTLTVKGESLAFLRLRMAAALLWLLRHVAGMKVKVTIA